MLVIWVGITVMFFLPRLMPGGPVETMIATVQAMGLGRIEPGEMEGMIHALREMYGLEGTLGAQYVSFWQRLFTGDFGPSLMAFPTPVIKLIGRALPWTVGLLLTSTLLAWIIGNVTGGLSGYFTRSRALKIVDGTAMFMRPMPHFILGLLLVIFFAYLFPVFPVGGGYIIGTRLAFTWRSVMDILNHAFLPAMSMILITGAAMHQTMRLLVQNVKSEDYIRYAKIGSVKERTIFARYVMRNAILPQITALALMLGIIFGGSLITEIVFTYPGMGMLVFRAILASDYNLLLGVTTISVILLATMILLIDFLYPLFDPRIRFK